MQVTSFRRLLTGVAALAFVAAGRAFAADNPLPPVARTLQSSMLQPPAAAGPYWAGTGDRLWDGTYVVADPGTAQVFIQRLDGTVVQTLVDPSAAPGFYRGFGAAAAVCGQDVLVFARMGPEMTNVTPPRLIVFRQAKPGAPWVHAQTLTLGSRADVGFAEANAVRLAVDPTGPRVLASWSQGVCAWSIVDRAADGTWGESGTSTLGNTFSTPNVAIRGSVAAVQSDEQLRILSRDAGGAWTVACAASSTDRAFGAPAILDDGTVAVPRPSTSTNPSALSPGVIDVFRRSSATGATWSKVQEIASGPLGEIGRWADFVGASGNGMLVGSAAPERGLLQAEELRPAPGGTWRRVRTLRATLPVETATALTRTRRVDLDADGALRIVPRQSPAGFASPRPVAWIFDWADADRDGIPDEQAIAGGTVPDCNANGVPDSADVALGIAADANGNGRPDACDADCDGDGLGDYAALLAGAADCNRNMVPDACDLLVPANDLDGNGRLDTCTGDCNRNGMLDEAEVAAGVVADCDSDGLPDSCAGYPMPAGLPAIGTTDATVSFWQPVDPANPVISAVRFDSWTPGAVGRRIMIVRDRGGQQDRLAVTAGDVLYFARMAVAAGGTDASGRARVVSQALPVVDLGSALGFWVVIEGVAMASNGDLPITRQARAESVSFAAQMPDPASWFRQVFRVPYGTAVRPAVSMLTVPCLNPADVTRDGALDGADLGAILGSWGLPDPICDLDRNGVVAGGDLAIFLAAWSNR